MLSTGLEIPGAAGGLRESLDIDPFEGHSGERVVVVLDTTVGKIRFDPIKDTNGWKRVHVLDVGLGMVVDADLVEDMLARQRERIAEHKADEEAKAKGLKKLEFDDAPGDAYSELDKDALKDLCRERDLPVGGKVEDLRDRLRANDTEGDPS